MPRINKAALIAVIAANYDTLKDFETLELIRHVTGRTAVEHTIVEYEVRIKGLGILGALQGLPCSITMMTEAADVQLRHSQHALIWETCLSVADYFNVAFESTHYLKDSNVPVSED